MTGWAKKREMAKYLSVSERTIDAMIADGLPVARYGRAVRIKYTDADEFMRRHQVDETRILEGIL